MPGRQGRACGDQPRAGQRRLEFRRHPVELHEPLLDLFDPLPRPDVGGGEVLDTLQVSHRGLEVTGLERMLGSLEVADQGAAVGKAEAARAAGLVHPVLPAAERTVPAERGPAVPALGPLGAAPRGLTVIGHPRQARHRKSRSAPTHHCHRRPMRR